MPPYVEAYPNENLTTVMPEQYRYTLPVKAGEQRLLGELTGAACATLVAEIAERHAGPVVLIAQICKMLCVCMMKSASSPIRW